MSETKFKKERVSTLRERKLITYCITSDDFLQAMIPVCEPSYLALGYSQRIWGWCKDYFEEYKKAPSRNIQDMYLLNRDTMEPADQDMITTFLADLSEQYDGDAPTEFDINNAKDYLTFRKAGVLEQRIKDARENQDIVALKEAFAEFATIETSTISPVDVMNDAGEVSKAFQYDHERLFRLPGAFGEMMGWVSRGDFFAFQGFAKSRKSWFLQYVAQVAEEWGLNVLLVDLEMTKSQRIRRIWTGIRREPKRDKIVRIPIFYKDDPDDSEEQWKVQYEESFRKAIDATVENVGKWQHERKNYYRQGGLRVLNLPPGSVTPEQMMGHVKNLEYFQNFKVDVLLVDYADKMKGEGKEERHRINSIWTKLRAYALPTNTDPGMAIGTASQSGRDAAEGDSNRGNIAEDIRKVAEVTHLLTISSTPQERAMGLVRLKNEASRDDEEIFDSVYVTSCLDIGCAVLDSRFRSEVDIPEPEGKKKRRGVKDGEE